MGKNSGSSLVQELLRPMITTSGQTSSPTTNPPLLCAWSSELTVMRLMFLGSGKGVTLASIQKFVYAGAGEPLSPRSYLFTGWMSDSQAGQFFLELAFFWPVLFITVNWAVFLS